MSEKKYSENEKKALEFLKANPDQDFTLAEIGVPSGSIVSLCGKTNVVVSGKREVTRMRKSVVNTYRFKKDIE